jgi:translation initiation factor 1A
MPKNKGKGGKGKRKGKRNKGKESEKREIRFKVFGEEYAQVRKVLGNCRVECFCFDGKLRLCHVRGKFKKRVWINKDDFVLVGLRDYQDDKGDIIHKYSPDEARLLRSWGEIPADKANFDDAGLEGDEGGVFVSGAAEEPGSEGSDDESDESEEDSRSLSGSDLEEEVEGL